MTSTASQDIVLVILVLLNGLPLPPFIVKIGLARGLAGLRLYQFSRKT
jgi:hypothetical protein